MVSSTNVVLISPVRSNVRRLSDAVVPQQAGLENCSQASHAACISLCDRLTAHLDYVMLLRRLDLECH
jgi:hypothetical protein